MEQFEINATVRKKTGNGPARELRRGGRIPAVLYGPQTEPVLLSVNVRELEQIIKKGNIGSAILNLVIQNGKKVTKPAMIKEFQSHPVSGQVNPRVSKPAVYCRLFGVKLRSSACREIFPKPLK